ncbi:MAG: Bax inhibitor-1 family protein [Candidatus Peregrinibacteria bacterium]|nr:Bax inhibitor-1 family protein [Candidatus Peregrinibacteria bacterium]
MQHYVPVRSQPLTLSSSTEAQTYLLFGVAMALTVVGVFAGMAGAVTILSSGVHFVLLLVEIAIIISAPWWMSKTPLNYLLFGLFPLLSGITITPYLLFVLTGYANGGTILVNALAATASMALAAGFFAKVTSWNLSGMARGLFFALIGLLCFGLLQLFFPSLRGTQMELFASGAGVVIFALFLAYDVQRIAHMGKVGANPFMLALSLYLDIFNLFLYVLRFMVALSGERR